MKKIILNADDFCLSPVFNDVIIELINESAISSTSVMIDRFDESQQEQVERLKNTTAGIGLHVEFASGENFSGEVQRQYNLFKEIFAQKPSHLDIHKTDYLQSGYPVIMQFASENNLPFCNHGFDLDNGITTSKQSIGAIHYPLDKIVEWINSFTNEDSGELVLHPGQYDTDCKTSLNYERAVDVTKARVIKKHCDDNDIKIISFSDL